MSTVSHAFWTLGHRSFFATTQPNTTTRMESSKRVQHSVAWKKQGNNGNYVALRILQWVWLARRIAMNLKWISQNNSFGIRNNRLPCSTSFHSSPTKFTCDRLYSPTHYRQMATDYCTWAAFSRCTRLKPQSKWNGRNQFREMKNARDKPITHNWFYSRFSPSFVFFVILLDSMRIKDIHTLV